MKEQFKEFNNRKISDKVCDIHQVNYWEISVPVLGGSERKVQAFCPECVKGEIKQKEKDYCSSSRTGKLTLKLMMS